MADITLFSGDSKRERHPWRSLSQSIDKKILEEGLGEFALFFEDDTSEQTHFQFEEYIAVHLQRKALPQSIQRRRLYSCPQCMQEMPNQIVQIAKQTGKSNINCPFCPPIIPLYDYEELLKRSSTALINLIDQRADQQRDLQADLITIEGKQATHDFDVFLCYHEADREEVEYIGMQLKERGLLSWLDAWEVPPGRLWLECIEQQISTVKTAAIFVGKQHIHPWQKQETHALLRQFAERDCRIIPVLLPGALRSPKLPLFLQGIQWVDFRQTAPDPLERLIWGITGRKHQAR